MTKPRYKTIVLHTPSLKGKMTWYGKREPTGSFDDDRERHPDFEAIQEQVQAACSQLNEDGYRVLQTIGLKSGFGAWANDGGLGYSYTSGFLILAERMSAA